MELLRVENLSKKYPGITALDNVSLAAASGSVTGIYGKKGSGKRTLIHLILGAEKPSSGNIFFQGNDITGLSMFMRQKAGIVSTRHVFSFFEKIAHRFSPIRSVEEYLRCLVPDYSGHLKRSLGKADKQQAITRALMSLGADMTGLYRGMNEQSGGQRQRIELASCLIREPALIAIDDPFFGLDAYNATECFHNLKNYASAHQIGFLFTMDCDDKAKSVIPPGACDVSYFLDHGKIVDTNRSEQASPVFNEVMPKRPAGETFPKVEKKTGSYPGYDFEIFISFKNNDAAGNQTRDSILAHEVYQFLSGKGLKVFYSNVSLENLGVAAYQSAIDKVLDQVNIVIAVGTSFENLNSEWVRYEWGSFYNDILSGRKRSGKLFVYTENILPKDLPRVLRQNQVIEHRQDSLETLYNFIVNAMRREYTRLSSP